MSGVVVLNQINARLVNAAGESLAVPDGYSLTVDNLGILSAGSDGYQAHFLRVDSDGVLRIDPTGETDQPVLQQAASSTRSSVAASLSNTILLPANSFRKSAIIYNDSLSGVLLVGYGAAVTSTNFTLKIGIGGFHHLTVPVFSGAINGLWTADDGYAYITELT